MTPSALPSILAMIRMMAAQGYGIDDIAVKLNLPRDQIKPFVLGRKG